MQGPDPTTVRVICGKLDPSNDEHWTSQGLPRMDVLAGMGLSIERRALTEAFPGFTRAVAAKLLSEAPATASETAQAPGERSASVDEHLANCGRHLAARAERRKAALAHLAAGGFTPADLDPVTSPIQRRIAAQNAAARRAPS